MSPLSEEEEEETPIAAAASFKLSSRHDRGILALVTPCDTLCDNYNIMIPIPAPDAIAPSLVDCNCKYTVVSLLLIVILIIDCYVIVVVIKCFSCKKRCQLRR